MWTRGPKHTPSRHSLNARAPLIWWSSDRAASTGSARSGASASVSRTKRIARPSSYTSRRLKEAREARADNTLLGRPVEARRVLLEGHAIRTPSVGLSVAVGAISFVVLLVSGIG